MKCSFRMALTLAAVALLAGCQWAENIRCQWAARHGDCCETTCCETTCCERTCCERTCCENGCCAADCGCVSASSGTRAPAVPAVPAAEVPKVPAANPFVAETPATANPTPATMPTLVPESPGGKGSSPRAKTRALAGAGKAGGLNGAVSAPPRSAACNVEKEALAASSSKNQG